MNQIKKCCLALVLVLLLPTLVMAEGQKEAKIADVPVLKWYFIGTPQADEDLVEAEVNKYIEPLIGATVDITCMDWGEYSEKMTTIISSGEDYDICFSTNWTNNYKNNIAKGAFMPLNDLLKSAPGIEKTLGTEFLYATAQNGTLYTLPANKEKAHNFGLLLRKDLVEKYNMDLSSIKTLADMAPLFQIIKENESTINPLGNWGSGDNLFMLLDWDRPVGSKVPVTFNAAGKIVGMLDEMKTIDMFNLARDFYAKGYVQADSATLSEFVADEAAGIIFATPKQLKPGKDGEYASTTPGFEWVQVDLTTPTMSNSETDGSMMAISVGSKNSEKAIKLLELMYTDKKLINLMVYGIEDIHYTKVSEEVIESVTDTKYNSGLGWIFGNQFLDYLSTGEASDKWEKFLAYNASSIPTSNLGFSFNPENVSNEISACLNVWDQYLPTLSAGAIEDVDGYSAKAKVAFKASGIDTIIGEMQTQYDLWLETK